MVVLIILAIASVAVIVLVILQLFNVWEQAINVYIPLLGVVNLCQAYLNWKQNRALAFLSIGVAALIFICSFVILIL